VYSPDIHSVMAGFPDEFEDVEGFQWDAGNADKNWLAHQVSQPECEQVFFNRPVLILPDATHSGQEARFLALGVTNGSRRLSVVYTVRAKLVRVISARDMSSKQRRVYGEA